MEYFLTESDLMHFVQNSVSMGARKGLTLIVLLAGSAACGAQTLEPCGNLVSPGEGPYDYRDSRTYNLQLLVEQGHFNRGVETLTRPIWGSFGGDISYTLQYFPNHPRALLAMIKLGIRETDKPRGATHTIGCFFDRAMRFQPGDGTARALYGYYLAKKGNKAEAMQQLEKAQELAGGNANTHDNAGLAYLELNELTRLPSRRACLSVPGHPLPGLREKLKAQGKRRE